jgi:cysteine sulfinate desulfinase/cysteine desulfurase-like protein
MGVEADVLAGSLRFSLGATTSRADVDEAVSRILAVCGRLADMSRRYRGSPQR